MYFYRILRKGVTKMTKLTKKELMTLLLESHTESQERLEETVRELAESVGAIKEKLDVLESLTRQTLFPFSLDNLADTPEGRDTLKTLEAFSLSMAVLAESLGTEQMVVPQKPAKQDLVEESPQEVVVDLDNGAVVGDLLKSYTVARGRGGKQFRPSDDLLASSKSIITRRLVDMFRAHPDYKRVKQTPRYKYVETRVIKKHADRAYVLCEYLNYAEKIYGFQVTAESSWEDIKKYVPRLSGYIWPSRDRLGTRIWDGTRDFVDFYLEWKTKDAILPMPAIRRRKHIK
jgi:hypothetical protein